VGDRSPLRLIPKTDAEAPEIRDDRPMRGAYRLLGRVVDVAIPWGVGVFLVLLILDGSERLWGVGILALGEAARNRRAAIREAARRAVGEEQARIARELHDVIAHSVSRIVVQAGAADDVFDSRPDQARAALRSIERAGRDALGELRRLLSAVRPGMGDAEPTGPQPGLDRLDELAEPLRAGGLRVVVRREGATTPLPAGVDLPPTASSRRP
jgi:signal transduction histidine kinase